MLNFQILQLNLQVFTAKKLFLKYEFHDTILLFSNHSWFLNSNMILSLSQSLILVSTCIVILIN